MAEPISFLLCGSLFGWFLCVVATTNMKMEPYYNSSQCNDKVEWFYDDITTDPLSIIAVFDVATS